MYTAECDAVSLFVCVGFLFYPIFHSRPLGKAGIRKIKCRMSILINRVVMNIYTRPFNLPVGRMRQKEPPKKL